MLTMDATFFVSTLEGSKGDNPRGSLFPPLSSKYYKTMWSLLPCKSNEDVSLNKMTKTFE